MTEQGVNLKAQGGSTIQIPGGILMASQCHGANCSGRYAGVLQGGQDLTSPFTYIRGSGTACAGNLGCTSSSSWIEPPVNGRPLDDPLVPRSHARQGPAAALVHSRQRRAHHRRLHPRRHAGGTHPDPARQLLCGGGQQEDRRPIRHR